MSFKNDFAAVLNVAAVTSFAGERIFPATAEQGCGKPYVVWRRNGGDPLATLGGVSRNRIKNDVLVGCYAETYDEAANLADAVFTALAAGGANLKIIPRPPADAFDPDTKLFVSVVEASVSYRSS